MKITPVKVEKYDVEAFHIEYRILVPSGKYLIFPVHGYTCTMRNPGVPSVHHDDGESMLIKVRYDMQPTSVMTRGDNTFPKGGDILCYLVEEDSQDQMLLNSKVVNLLEQMDKRIAELEKPKKRGRKKKED